MNPSHDLAPGNPAPDFQAIAVGGDYGDGREISLASLNGHTVVLYFYPKDDTPGCTTQACGIRDHYERFLAAGAKVFGVSIDSPTSHAKFIEKFQLPFPLISDESRAIVSAYGVWVEKSMYGKKYMGTERSTFVIGPDGRIAEIFRKAKPTSHAEDVLNALTLNREQILTVYDKLTSLVEKLPGGLQRPILKELTPIRELFLEQRPARIVILGGEGRSGQEVLDFLGLPTAACGQSHAGWRAYHVAERGEIQLLDGRLDVPDDHFHAALAAASADLSIVLDGLPDEESWKRTSERAVKAGAAVLAVPDAPERSHRMQALLASQSQLVKAGLLCKTTLPEEPKFHEILCAALPPPARLEFARVSGAKRAQALIAGTLLKSFSAVCGVIGVQPIPLADMPVLTTLQTLMVSLIIHTSGRRISPRLLAEFLGVVGLNIGAGLLLREGARAIVKIVPIWGNAVSGFIAGAGTYAIGRAAIAYFIEGVPLEETKSIFHKFLPRQARKNLPPPSLPPS